jgi:hypothetical protein
VYERFAWRYRFSDRLWGTFAVRSIADRKADALEFGFGYQSRPR